ncbi:MAG: molybdenum cofactor biosynthesis protein MoaE [Rhodobacterales bacterium]
MSVSVQEGDFDLGQEITDMTKGRRDIGAVVSFIGLVRDSPEGGLLSMELEHYPGMTEQALAEIEKQAAKRWSLNASRIIHRFGDLPTGAQIMMVATASPHRGHAFEAAEFLMDYLKTDAPFWKKEHFKDGAGWVDSKAADADAKQRWSS